jgi:hypothetical protein
MGFDIPPSVYTAGFAKSRRTFNRRHRRTARA